MVTSSENLKVLGSGIGQVESENASESYLGIHYVIDENALRIVRALGIVHHHLEEERIKTAWRNSGELALRNNRIWTKNKSGEINPVLHNIGIEQIRKTFLNNREKPGVYSFSHELSKESKEIVYIRVLERESANGVHQAWIPRSMDRAQVVLDCLVSIHYDRQALNGTGKVVAGQEIEEITHQEAFMFQIAENGEILLPDLK